MEDVMKVGPFELIRPLGKGLMGVVWEGRHCTQDVPVAVKFLTASGAQDKTFRQAFSNEVRAVARLHHPSIIRLLDYGITDDALNACSGGVIAQGSPYYAMEFANGGTLPKPKSALPWEQTRYLLLTLLDALAHAHARGVIHRDIKPGNILIRQEGQHQRVMLTDFGVAKAVGVSELQDGIVVGTPRYMAPEQIMNATRDQGPWTDLYSIGCLAYLFASGHRIFSHARGEEVLRCQVGEMPEPLYGRHLPEGFWGWLSKMLAKKTSDRYEYAAEAAWALVSLPEPECSEPETAQLESNEHGQESGDSGVVGGESSSVFRTLCQSSQNPRAERVVSFSDASSEKVDIAEDLLNDMGDTVRMDASAIADVVRRQTQSRGTETEDWETLAEVYRSRAQLPGATSCDGSVQVPVPATWRRETFESGFGQLLGAGLGLWGLRTIPMVDRNTERDLIYHQLLATGTDHKARCILFDGAHGIGKSRIIEWMSQRAHELSIAHTLKAIHYKDHKSAPGIVRAVMYDLVCQNLTRDKALERIQRFLSEHPLSPERNDALPLLELMQLPDDPQHPIARIRFENVQEKYHVLCRYLRRVSHDRSVILWLDDLHFSSFSLGFALYLLNSEEARGIPVLILGTVRSEDMEKGSNPYSVYKRLIGESGVTSVTVQALSSSDHQELVQKMIGLDAALCEQVAERTSGIPLFAIQLIGDWIERGVLEPGKSGFKVKDGASVDVPDSLHSLWISRMRLIFNDRESGNALEQLEIAASLGREFDADEWRIASSMAELGDTSRTLECMLRHQLVDVQYPNVRFSHDLLWESLIRNARENGRDRSHHQICADMLQAYFSEALTFYYERRADHLYAAQAWEACIEPYLQAGIVRRQRGEFAMAHVLFRKREEAIEQCKADADSPIRALGWIAEADTYLQEIALDRVEPLTEQAIALGQRTQSPVVQALAYKTKGELLHSRNNITEALDALMISLSFFNQIGERRKALYLKERADALWLIGRICDSRHELELARIYFQQAIDIQLETNDSYGLARAYKALGNTYQHGGLYEDARKSLTYALQIFEKMGYRLYVAHCLNDIGEIYRLGYLRPDQAEEWYRKAMDVYREVDPIHSTTTVINLVLLLLSKERFTEAKMLVIEQIETVERTGQSYDLNWLYAELLPCCCATFDWPRFDATAERLRDVLETSMVVDADILYCTGMATQLCDRYATRKESQLCREIAIQQAVRLNDNAALVRLQET